MRNVNLDLINLCPRDSVMFDIGANHGRFTVQMAKFPERKVYAFEPEPNNLEVLREKLTKSAGRERIEVHGLALSNKIGTQRLYLNPGNPGGHTLNEKLLGKFKLTEDNFIEIVVTTLDKWCEQNSIKRVDGIKIDVEAHEVEVIQGAMKTLKRFKPIIALETHKTVDVDELKRLLEECGYEVPEMLENRGYYLKK